MTGFRHYDVADDSELSFFSEFRNFAIRKRSAGEEGREVSGDTDMGVGELDGTSTSFVSLIEVCDEHVGLQNSGRFRISESAMYAFFSARPGNTQGSERGVTFSRVTRLNRFTSLSPRCSPRTDSRN